jgi:antitoxin component of MazEF toxin-antitoxin module
MLLRKLISIGGLVCVSLPRKATEQIGWQKGDFVEVYFQDKNTLILRRHKVQPLKIQNE